MIEVELPDGRVIEVNTTDQQAAAAAARAFLQRQGGMSDPTAAARERLSQDVLTPGNALSAAAQGFNSGLAGLVGAPVDLVNNAPRLLGGNRMTEQPIGGSDWLRELTRSQQPADMPDELRPFARAGEVVGSALPFAAAPLAAATRAGGAALGGVAAPQAGLRGVADSMVRNAAQNPGAVAAREAGMISGAAQGAALAELAFPNDPIAGMVGEIGGAFVAPSSIVAQAGSRALDGASRAIQSFTPAGRQRAAGTQLDKLLKEAGEDPQAILRSLDQPDQFGFSLAERSQSPTLMGLRQVAAKSDVDFARRAAEGDARAVEALTQRIRQVVDPGDAGALTRAAKTQADDLMAQVEDIARTAAKPFEGADAASRAAANVQAREALEAAFDNARAVEKSLWSNVPQGAPVRVNWFLRSADTMARERRLAMRSLPGEVRSEIDRYRAMMQNGRVPEARDVLALRSELLDYARAARSGANADPKMAGIYGRLADGLLNDLGALPATADARAFSKRLHDRFSRTVAGDILRLKGSGADAVPAAQTLERAGRGNAAARDQQFRELTDATSPSPITLGAYRGRTPDFSPPMREAQEQFLRADAGVLDAAGQISGRRAQSFLNQNDPMLGRFPGLRQQVQDAADAARAQGAAAGRLRPQQQILAAGEQPQRAVAQALTGANPAADYAALAKVAQQGGKEAVAGLRASTFDFLRQAAANGDAVSFKALSEALTRPMGSNGVNLLRSMRESGVISTTQEARLRKALVRGLQHEASVASARVPGQIVDDVSDFFDLVVRVAGANVGGAGAAGQMTGTPLVAAQAGSRVARRLLEKMPQQRVRDLLFKALEDEQLLKAMLTKMDGPRARAAERQINAAILGLAARTGAEALE
jgi:hypothetical protein